MYILCTLQAAASETAFGSRTMFLLFFRVLPAPVFFPFPLSLIRRGWQADATDLLKKDLGSSYTESFFHIFLLSWSVHSERIRGNGTYNSLYFFHNVNSVRNPLYIHIGTVTLKARCEIHFQNGRFNLVIANK